MKESLLVSSALFSGITPTEITSLLSCLSAREQTYAKGTFIHTYGTVIHSIGFVLSGSVHIVKEDFWGNRMIIGRASAGELFGEAYACRSVQPLEVSIVAAQNTSVLFLDVRKILTTCPSPCAFHSRIIENLISIFAQKNLMLTRKMEHMAKKTTREKLLSYLSAESLKKQSPYFQIPFNRQQLADYLAVDRSAMSHELCKLRDEGILEFQKNQFKLKQTDVDAGGHGA